MPSEVRKGGGVNGLDTKVTGTPDVDTRVVRAAEQALAEQGYVAAVDVFVRMRWLEPARLDELRQGRLTVLEDGIQVRPAKLAAAMETFRRWALERGLEPTEADYVARTRDRRTLRFSTGGDPEVERAWRTQWVSPDLPASRRRRLVERQSKAPDLVVIDALNDWTCTECSSDAGGLMLLEGPGPLCMACADFDHLVFLPRGDTALTRRARKASSLSVVVVRFSRARKRYERQGILVEEAALARAEEECLADEEARARRRVRDEERRVGLDADFVAAFAAAISDQFPGCPPERSSTIAAHAALRGSGRVGRSAAGRALDPDAVRLAVVAAVRHEDTRYDGLLMSGADRAEARDLVRDDVERVLESWSRRAAADQGRR
jgi:hypothetical protein